MLQELPDPSQAGTRNLPDQVSGSSPEQAEDKLTPQDFGFPANPTAQQAHAWHCQEVFLASLAKHGRVCDGAKDAGVTVSTAERWDSVDLYGFKKRKEWAKQAHLERIEAEIERRAIEGVDKPVYWRDQRVGTIREYSDNLLMFRAKRLDPAYKDNHQPQQASTAISITRTVIEIHDYRGNESLAQGRAAQIVDGEARDIVTDTGDESLSADELT